MSVSLPASTRQRIETFNPRNRSAFFNQAVLDFIHRNDPDMAEQRQQDFRDAVDHEIENMPTKRLAAILLNRCNPSMKQLRQNLIRLIHKEQAAEAAEDE